LALALALARPWGGSCPRSCCTHVLTRKKTTSGMHFYTVLTCFSCCTHVLTRKKRRAVPRRIAWGPPACTFTQFLVCRCMFVSFAAPALRPSMLHVRRCMFLSCVVRRFPSTLDVRRCMFLSFAARPCGWLALVLRRGVRCRTFVVACSCPSLFRR